MTSFDQMIFRHTIEAGNDAIEACAKLAEQLMLRDVTITPHELADYIRKLKRDPTAS